MIVLYIGVFAALGLFLIAGALFLFGSSSEEESRVFRRFKEVTDYQAGNEPDLDEEMLEGSFYDRAIYPILQRVAGLIGQDEDDQYDKLEQRLIRAGRPGGLGSNEFLALQICLGLLSVALVVFMALLIGPTTMQGIGLSIVFAAGAGLGSYIVPKFYLSLLISRRQKEIRLSLPYAIDLLVVSAEAGLGFEMALNRVVSKMEGPLIEEFQRVLEEIKLGAVRKKAMKKMARRVQVDDLSTFVSAVVQAEDLGASIGQTLRVQADQMRTARRQELEENAQKAPVKMLFPMVFFIFPTIFIVIIGPIGLEVYKKLAGAGF